MKGDNTAVVSVKVPKRIKEKMRSIDVQWSEVLRKAIEAKIKEQERKQAVTSFLEFRSKSKVPKNKTPYTSEVLVRETREER
ncbi:MAG: hypothetical protein QXJ74_02640 [Nitrososphaera sp.]|uniref:hypothetical protein n=1 Tax=Nitrososphaera sp. TaxID=1971748 RepID=UPI00179A5244|nr:hypothetical protein [Nitrososphaera sp.]NWG36289.1 hypothetical protein [Nitrososphaera sp.]